MTVQAFFSAVGMLSTGVSSTGMGVGAEVSWFPEDPDEMCPIPPWTPDCPDVPVPSGKGVMSGEAV